MESVRRRMRGPLLAAGALIACADGARGRHRRHQHPITFRWSAPPRGRESAPWRSRHRTPPHPQPVRTGPSRAHATGTPKCAPSPELPPPCRTLCPDTGPGEHGRLAIVEFELVVRRREHERVQRGIDGVVVRLGRELWLGLRLRFGRIRRRQLHGAGPGRARRSLRPRPPRMTAHSRRPSRPRPAPGRPSTVTSL